MEKLILIRHGETDYTYKRRYCGHNNIPLNKRGLRQAESLRPRLNKMKVDSIYSSDLSRALQTAEILFKDKKICKKKGLREIDFGRFCGLTFEEADRLYPDVYKTWLSDPSSVKIPKGENFSGFTKRVTGCFKKISDQNKEKVVAIVSHGGPIRIILLYLLRAGLDGFWDIEQDTAALNIVEFKNKVLKLAKINDTSHLQKGKL